MEDRESVAGIAAGDQAGLAAAYDKYAAPLYGYCYWMLREPAAAADALQKTFIAASAKLGARHDAGQLQSWLYGVARDECECKPRAAGAGADDRAETAEQPAGPRPADAGPTDARQAAQQTEVRRLIGATLAGLKPDEREAIELGVRHGLDDAELAAVLGVSWRRAHALSSHAQAQLERILGALLIARTGRKDCPALDALLARWDGRLSVPTSELVSRHVDECRTCAARKHGRFRPEVLAGLLPLPPATLPLGLREQLLRRARMITEPAGDRRQVIPPEGTPRPTGFPRAAALMGWARIKDNPGAATAVVILVMWVVAAISATLAFVDLRPRGRTVPYRYMGQADSLRIPSDALAYGISSYVRRHR